MSIYHATKHKNTLPSLELVVLQAMQDELDKRDSDAVTMPTYAIVERARGVLLRWDITDSELSSVDVQKVGMMLGRIGFKKSASHGSYRSWVVSRRDLAEKAKVAGVTLEDSDNENLPEIDRETPITLRDVDTQWLAQIDNAADKPILW